jgi:nicotinamidase-related amidase
MPENLETIGQESLLFGSNDAIRAANVAARNAGATGSEECFDPTGPAFHRSGMKLDIEHAALVVIDPQIDFLDPQASFTRHSTESRAIQNLARLLKASKHVGLTVAISLTSPRELASEIVPALQHYAGDSKTIISWPHIVYRQPRINDVGLRLRQQRVHQVILAGMIVSLPIESHLRDFLAQGFEIAVVRDAVAGARLPEGIGHLSALVNFRCIVNALWTTDETIRRLG